VSGIILHTTRLSELPCPERLVTVDLEPKSFKNTYDGRDRVNGDDDIISIHAHLPDKISKILSGKASVERVLNPNEATRKKRESFKRKAER
jgi:hypothetical protein